MRLDHRERRPQLVRRVGGEVQLAPAGRLDRRRDAAADRHRAEEHRGEEDRRDQELGEDDRRARVVDGSSDCPTITQSSPTCRPGEPEVDAADRRRGRAHDAAELGREGRVAGRGRETLPSDSTGQTRSGAPTGRSVGGGIVRAAGRPRRRRGAAGRTTAVSRWSIWSVRSARDEHNDGDADRRGRRARRPGRRERDPDRLAPDVRGDALAPARHAVLQPVAGAADGHDPDARRSAAWPGAGSSGRRSRSSRGARSRPPRRARRSPCGRRRRASGASAARGSGIPCEVSASGRSSTATWRVTGSRASRPRSDGRRVDAARPALEGADPGEQLAEVERLHEVVVGARVEAVDPVRRRVAGGQHQDRGRPVVAARPVDDVDPLGDRASASRGSPRRTRRTGAGRSRRRRARPRRRGSRCRTGRAR